MELKRQPIPVVAVPLLFLCLMAFADADQSPSRPSTATSESAAVRNNAAALLYQLLGDEKDVSKLLIIKRDRRELHQVIKSVASTSDAARKALEKFARGDNTLNLKDTALPPGEKAARAAEAKTRQGELLHASGADLEFKLLLTQAEALAYAEHLAKVAAQNEPVPDRAKVFTTISEQMNALHQQVISLLRSGAK
jgi:hypothetical protein